jgi:hypothetical protein
MRGADAEPCAIPPGSPASPLWPDQSREVGLCQAKATLTHNGETTDVSRLNSAASVTSRRHLTENGVLECALICSLGLWADYGRYWPIVLPAQH